MSKAVRIDLNEKNWSTTRPEDEVHEPTKDEVRGKRDHKHKSRDKDKKDRKYDDDNWN